MREIRRSGGGRAWTAEQQRAIERRQGDLLLDAGAGSGKTSVLVERFVRAVLDDGVDVAAILTITFTEKAAAELRDRIRARLRELGADEAARRTEGAFISTIHGFCARVLRAHALAAGLDPEFTVLDRQRSEPLSAAAFEDALPELARGRCGAVDLIAAYGAGPLRAATLVVYGQLRSAGSLRPRLPGCRLRRRARRRRGGAGGGRRARWRPSWARSPTPSARVLRGAGAGAAQPGAGRRRRGRVWPARSGRGAAAAQRRGAWHRRVRGLHRGAGGVPRGRAARAARPVRDLLDRLLAGYGGATSGASARSRGWTSRTWSCSPASCWATTPSCGSATPSASRWIMVDELQDTNRVQLELIESIARDNLFTVGDAQQSIYGFRHADVELFAARGAAAGRGRRAGDAADELPLAAGDPGGAQPRRSRPSSASAFCALRPAGRPTGRADDAAVELLVVDKGADWELEGLAAPWRLAEARALADRVGRAGRRRRTPGRDRGADARHHRHARLRAGAGAARVADLRDRRPRLLVPSAGGRHRRLPARAGQPP